MLRKVWGKGGYCISLIPRAGFGVFVFLPLYSSTIRLTVGALSNLFDGQSSVLQGCIHFILLRLTIQPKLLVKPNLHFRGELKRCRRRHLLRITLRQGKKSSLRSLFSPLETPFELTLVNTFTHSYHLWQSFPVTSALTFNPSNLWGEEN